MGINYEEISSVMTEELLFILTLISALGSGLMAGLFFAFSTSVMKALDRLPANESIVAMQSINTTIVNPLFLALFLGTTAGCLALIIISILHWNASYSIYLLFGSISYLAGSF